MLLSRRVHLLSTPNVQATAAYYLDVFNGITRRFSELLTELGWTVYLYGSEECDVPCQELVTCISKREQEDLLDGKPYQTAWYDAMNPLWQKFNIRANQGIQARKEPGDLIATVAGSANLPIWQQHSDLQCLEYSIGYRGVFAPYRVFQSQAWRHVIHGATGCEYGRTTDDVIYHWLHDDEFPSAPPEGFLLYVGRLAAAKGLKTVCRTAARAGRPLYLIGEGDPALITYGTYLGHMPPAERNHWMARADALLCPTDYIEPSATVVVEAQLCGTPVISTPWGGFSEYIEDGVTARTNCSGDLHRKPVTQVRDLSRDVVRARAQRLYGWDAGKIAYQAYFDRIERLGEDQTQDQRDAADIPAQVA